MNLGMVDGTEPMLVRLCAFFDCGQVFLHEPAPQTLYYKPGAKPGQPVMVNVALQYGKATTAARTRRRPRQ